MLFWISLIVLVIGIVCLCVYDNASFAGENWCTFGVIFTVVGALASMIIGVFMCINLTMADVTKAANQERYKALTYKLESDAYKDEFGLINKSVIDEIQDWNEDVVSNKALQRNFWIGICIPNIYDDFETIDYEKFIRRRY